MKDLVFSPISIKDLMDAISQVVEEKIKSALSSPNKSKEKINGSIYGTRKEVGLVLKMSLPTVDNRTKRGILKRHDTGGRAVLYKWSEVQEAIEKGDLKKYRRT